MIDKQTHSKTFQDLAIKYITDVAEFKESALQFPKYSATLMRIFCNDLKNSLIDFAVITKMSTNRKTAELNLLKALFIENVKVWFEAYKQKFSKLVEI